MTSSLRPARTIAETEHGILAATAGRPQSGQLLGVGVFDAYGYTGAIPGVDPCPNCPNCPNCQPAVRTAIAVLLASRREYGQGDCPYCPSCRTAMGEASSAMLITIHSAAAAGCTWLSQLMSTPAILAHCSDCPDCQSCRTTMQAACRILLAGIAGEQNDQGWEWLSHVMSAPVG